MVQFDVLTFFIQLVWLFCFIYASYIFILKTWLLKIGRALKKRNHLRRARILRFRRVKRNRIRFLYEKVIVVLCKNVSNKIVG